MKYIKKFNEELNPKKAIIGGAIAASLLGGCSKDDSLSVSIPKINQVDSLKTANVDTTKEIDVDKSKLEPPKKSSKSKTKKNRILKFKKFFKKK
jgi:hypothetical protein